jgi:hypothetical protein
VFRYSLSTNIRYPMIGTNPNALDVRQEKTDSPDLGGL